MCIFLTFHLVIVNEPNLLHQMGMEEKGGLLRPIRKLLQVEVSTCNQRISEPGRTCEAIRPAPPLLGEGLSPDRFRDRTESAQLVSGAPEVESPTPKDA